MKENNSIPPKLFMFYSDMMKQCPFPFIILILCLLTKTLTAQPQQQMSCMRELGFCIDFLNNNDDNSTDGRPPDHCCQPLDYVVNSVPGCLCSLMSLMGLENLPGKLNISRALTLPIRCGQTTHLLDCSTSM